MRDASNMLPDGEYDVMIVDARELDDGRIALDCAVASGTHRGATTSVVARSIADVPLGARDETDLLGLPCTLVVERSSPRIEP